MQIIAHKNNIISYVNFFENVANYEFIDGFSVPIIKTKDNQIVVFENNTGQGTSTETIQNNTIADLQETTIFSLNTLLTDIMQDGQLKKRIILNVYPLIMPILSNETIGYVNNKNKEYINDIKEIIDKFPTLDISLCCINTHLLQEMKRSLSKYPLGLIVDQENPIYLETDFYVLNPLMLDEVIIKEELDIGKEIIISITNNDDLNITYNFFKNGVSPLKKEIMIKLTYITDSPRILYDLLN